MNTRQIEIDLDNAWWGHGNIKYDDKLQSVKLMGFKVYRNQDGKHKVVKNPNSGDYFTDFFNDMLGSKK